MKYGKQHIVRDSSYIKRNTITRFYGAIRIGDAKCFSGMCYKRDAEIISSSSIESSKFMGMWKMVAGDNSFLDGILEEVRKG